MKKVWNDIILFTGLVILWSMAVPSGTKEAKAEQGKAESISTRVICKQPNCYLSGPTVARTSDGELIVVFSDNGKYHVSPWGKIQVIRSSDNGKTWSEPVTALDTPLDDRNTGLIATKEGTLLATWIASQAFADSQFLKRFPDDVAETWRRYADSIGTEKRKRYLGSWVMRSADNGKTWEDPIKVPVMTSHGPIQLRDGRLLYVGRTEVDENSILAVLESFDDGRSWQRIGTVPIPSDDKMENFHEPHVAELKNGKLIVMIRYQVEPRVLKQSESNDGGRTWTVTHDTPLWGYPPHLLRLRDGHLLVVYGHRREPFGERACVSYDGGETWDSDNVIELAKAFDKRLGYPSSVELDDGSIWTVYYQIDKPGELPCLMGTHWRIK